MKILITAGATWVKVDDVRILTNIFTGKTGLYLAGELKKRRHSVTLIINPHCLGKVKIKNLKVIPYRYFDEFKKAVVTELKNNHYDAIVHSAAVSDYEVKNPFRGKIPSGSKTVTLKLIPTEKVIKQIRKLAKTSLLIQFKLEPKRQGLINDAYNSLKENNSDFVVANALEDLKLGYKGFIIDKDKKIIPVDSKLSLVDNLNRIIAATEVRKGRRHGIMTGNNF